MTFFDKKYFYTYWWVYVFVFALLLRLPSFFMKPLWSDEIVSCVPVFNIQSLQDLIDLARASVHPVLPFLFARFWTGIFGVGQIALRMPSLILGMFSVGAVLIFAKEIAPNNRIMHAVATVAAAVSLLHIQYSAEARPYTFLFLIGLISLYLFVKVIKSSKWSLKYLFLLFLANLIALYTHYDAFVFVFVEYALLFALILFKGFRQIFALNNISLFRGNIIKFWLVIISTVGAYAYWIPTLFREYSPAFQNMGLIRVPRPANPFFFVDYITQIFWLSSGAGNKILFFSQFVGSTSLIVLFIFGAWRLWQSRNLLRDQERSMAVLMLVIVGYFVVYFFSPLSVEYTPQSARHIVLILPAIFLVFGWVFASIDFIKQYIIGSLLVLTLIVPAYNYFLHTRTSIGGPWGNVASAISLSNNKFDKIIIDGNALSRVSFNYYAQQYGLPMANIVHFIPEDELEDNYEYSVITPQEQLLEIYVTSAQLAHAPFYFTKEFEELIQDVQNVWVIQSSPILHNRILVWMCVNGWEVKDVIRAGTLDAVLVSRLEGEITQEHLNKCVQFIP